MQFSFTGVITDLDVYGKPIYINEYAESDPAKYVLDYPREYVLCSIDLPFFSCS